MSFSVEALLASAKASTSSGGVDALFAAAKASSGGSSDSALLTAAKSGDCEALKRAISTGANLDCTGPWDGNTPLHWAVDKGHLECVRALCESGAAVNARERWQSWTPLMVAASKDRCKEAELLLAYGADRMAKAKGSVAADHALGNAMLAILKPTPADAGAADASLAVAGSSDADAAAPEMEPAVGADVDGGTKRLVGSVERLSPHSASLRPQLEVAFGAFAAGLMRLAMSNNPVHASLCPRLQYSHLICSHRRRQVRSLMSSSGWPRARRHARRSRWMRPRRRSSGCGRRATRASCARSS
jgi:hypothetical protein